MRDNDVCVKRPTFVRMTAQGHRLRNYFDENGIKYLSAAQKLDVHVNTLRNWMSQEELTQSALNKLVSTFPSIIGVFKEVQFWSLNVNQFRASNSETLEQEDIHKRYQDLLHRYNELLEKHVALQEQLMLK
jgi:plasmid maintenance system antidote protein VapI